MKPTVPQQIVVSGELLPAKSTEAAQGDIYVYSRNDQNGRFARAGGHTNAGYSGYFLASIYDGASWRKLQLNELIPYADRSFAFANQSLTVQDTISRTIRTWEGLHASHVPARRAFTIPSRVLAVPQTV